MEIEADIAANNNSNAAASDIENGLVVVVAEAKENTFSSNDDDEETITKGEETRRSVYLVWEEVSVLLPSFGKKHTKRVLDCVCGYALPARILAVMGPSGSGKSTLLDSLAGRLCGNLVMTGNVLLNGRKTNLDYGGVAYVTQDDIFLGTLTVRETIVYSAQLRLPCNTTKEEANDIIETTILEMGLQDCADNIIGNWHSRGISGGEKKRLSIALEILTQPQLLFLDEPTSGLDSASAFFVTQVLKNVACGGKTVISSVHQPSSEVFALFDDLLLLSGGETVYFGEAKRAMEFFADSGFPCPSRRNPSDHFLRCTNSDFDEVNTTLKQSRRISDIDKSCAYLEKLSTTEIKVKLIQKYKWSNYSMIVKTRIQEIKVLVSQKGFQAEIRKGSHAGWLKQLTTLTERSFKNMSRDFGYYWLRIVVYILLSICVGTVFHDVGTNYHAILARGACGGFISGFMTFMAIGGFPCFIEEMKIFTKERLKGHYGVAVFIVSNFMSSFPFLVMISLSSSSITYYTAKFRPGLSHFSYAVLDLLLSICIVESCMMVVASFVPNFLMGLIIGAGFIGIMMATAGFFRLLPQLPKPFWRYPISYINFMSWGLQGAYKNDMIGIEFDGINPGDPKLKGEYIIKNILGFSIQHSKWWDITVVFFIFIAYRMLFYIVLKLKEKGYPMFRSFYTKQTIHHLSKRASFRKVPPFPSKRYQTTPTLSSQDGFDSPIH